MTAKNLIRLFKVCLQPHLRKSLHLSKVKCPPRYYLAPDNSSQVFKKAKAVEFTFQQSVVSAVRTNFPFLTEFVHL